MAVTVLGRVPGDAFRSGLEGADRRPSQLPRYEAVGFRLSQYLRGGDRAVAHVR